MVAWTDERVSEFKKLYDDKLSFGLIADRMVISRNALIGKAHRLGWPRRKDAAPTMAIGRRSRPRSEPRVRHAKPVLSPVPVAPTPAPAPVVISCEHMVQVMDLDNHHCRYPLWREDTPLNEQWYCGAPSASVSDGRPYCIPHHRIAFNRPERNPPKADGPWQEAAE